MTSCGSPAPASSTRRTLPETTLSARKLGRPLEGAVWSRLQGERVHHGVEVERAVDVRKAFLAGGATRLVADLWPHARWVDAQQHQATLPAKADVGDSQDLLAARGVQEAFRVERVCSIDPRCLRRLPLPAAGDVKDQAAHALAFASS